MLLQTFCNVSLRCMSSARHSGGRSHRHTCYKLRSVWQKQRRLFGRPDRFWLDRLFLILVRRKGYLSSSIPVVSERVMIDPSMIAHVKTVHNIPYTTPWVRLRSVLCLRRRVSRGLMLTSSRSQQLLLLRGRIDASCMAGGRRVSSSTVEES